MTVGVVGVGGRPSNVLPRLCLLGSDGPFWLCAITRTGTCTDGATSSMINELDPGGNSPPTGVHGHSFSLTFLFAEYHDASTIST